MSNEVHALCKRRQVGSSVVKAVLLYMADSASDDGTGIWASKANMSRDLELSKRAVQMAVADLIERGLCVEVGQRKCLRGFTIEYRLSLEGIASLPSTRGETGESGARVNPIHPYGRIPFTPTGESHSPKPSLEPSLEPSLFGPSDSQQVSTKKKKPINTPNAELEESFQRFWAVYPRKQSPGDARSSWAKALKKATAEQLIAGAKAYADHCAREGTSRTYTALPATWLNKERWSDHAPAASGLSEIEMALKMAEIEEQLGNPSAAARHMAEARRLGWKG